MKYTSCFDHNGIIVVTGATGWVGKNFISELQNILPPKTLGSKLKLFSSRPGYLILPSMTFLPDGATVNLSQDILRVYSLSSLHELPASSQVSTIFHTAFLTRDKIPEVGYSSYIQTNQWITSQVVQALSCSPRTKVVNISSGAAAVYDTQCDPRAYLDVDPYGVLKHQDEVAFANLPNISLTIRIYALSGKYMHHPQRFALGSFLLSALKNNPIHIHSRAPVFRSYASASDIARYALKLCCSDNDQDSKVISAVSHTVSLLELANTITRMYCLPPPRCDVDDTLPPDSYIADTKPFLNQMQLLGLQATALEDQLEDTAKSLAHHLIA